MNSQINCNSAFRKILKSLAWNRTNGDCRSVKENTIGADRIVESERPLAIFCQNSSKGGREWGGSLLDPI